MINGKRCNARWGRPGERPCLLVIELLIHDAEELWRRRKRHDKAVEQLQAAQATWSRKRTEHLDFINGKLCRQGHAVKTFRDVDAAMQEYAQITGHNLDPLGAKPQLADFYHLSDGQKDHEIAFVTLGMAGTGFVAYQFAKK